MQDTMKKRFPDSVTNLVRAANYSDSAQEKMINQYQQTIESLGKELNETKDDFQRKLRSLRQEYEKLKMKHDALTTQMESDKKTSTPISHRPIGKVATLGQAHSRIRLLSLLHSEVSLIITM